MKNAGLVPAFFRFIAAFRGRPPDFQKKYSESLNPYAIRFIAS